MKSVNEWMSFSIEFVGGMASVSEVREVKSGQFAFLSNHLGRGGVWNRVRWVWEIMMGK